VRPERLGPFKKYTSSGLEPATFWLAAQCLNHYATARSASRPGRFPLPPGDRALGTRRVVVQPVASRYADYASSDTLVEL
jgi:hypothetical protein